jgi:choline dehydrogenase-like flavoprotein
MRKTSRILHSLKLQASPQLRRQLHLHPVLAHMTLTEPENSGLNAVRALLLARQQNGFLYAIRQNAAQLPSAALEALHLAWSAQFHRRRYISPQTRAELVLNSAQDAPSTSRITLSGKLDAYGQPLPALDWRISTAELHTLRTFARHLRQQFERQGLTSFTWKPELFGDDDSFLQLDDARHAMGGACMGHNPTTSVVNPDLTVHGIENLHIASPATFPTGDPPFPTLPLIALTLRLAARLGLL